MGDIPPFVPAGTASRVVIIRVLGSRLPISEARVSEAATETDEQSMKYAHSWPPMKKFPIAIMLAIPPLAITFFQPLTPALASSADIFAFSSNLHLVAKEPTIRKVMSTTSHVQCPSRDIVRPTTRAAMTPPLSSRSFHMDTSSRTDTSAMETVRSSPSSTILTGCRYH